MPTILADQHPKITPRSVRGRGALSCLLTIMRQTHLCQNDKTVIRRAADVHAKLCEQYSADGFGDAPHFVPDPVKIERHRCHSTFHQDGRAGFSSAHDNKRLPLSERRLYATTFARCRADTIVGYDVVVRSSALECWANAP